MYQNAKLKSEPWDPRIPAYVQFWRDIPGQVRPRRAKLALGICKSRTAAERRAAERLEELGINSKQHFTETTSTTTFFQQGEIWLKSLETRKRHPLQQTTIDNRRYALEKWIYPFFEGRLLAGITNQVMKELVNHMVPKLSAASIRDYSNIVKAVVASATDENGEELFPRKWKAEFIDAPIIEDQRQPSTDAAGMKAILGRASGQYRVLYALLAGCGPLRVGEALGLEIGKHISEDCRTLYVRQKAKRGEIQESLKTKNGKREVDLCSALANVLRDFIGERKSGLLFQTASGKQVLQSNTLEDSLHPILDALNHEKGGFNIFRRSRITHLDTSDCPDALQHFWSGHAHNHVSERYLKLLKKRDWRLDWAERVGLGFEVPPANGLRGLPGFAIENCVSA